jgi:hypothetical protein
MSTYKYASGRAIPNAVDFGESKERKTPFIEVQIQTYKPDGTDDEVIPFKGSITQDAIRYTIDALRLLGARCAGEDFGDLEGLGSKIANLKIEVHPQYGTRVQYINPPGRSSVRDDSRIAGDKLAALRASMKKIAAGASVPTRAPVPSATPPWQQNGPAASAPPWQPAQQPANPAADVDPWNAPDAYEGLEQPPANESAPVAAAAVARRVF